MQRFRQVTHVLFDLDGLLLDSEHVYKMAITNIAKKFGKTYTPEIQAKLIGTVDTLSSEIAVNEMKLPISPEQFLQQFRASTKRTFQKPVPLMPGAERLVRHLHCNRVPIAVASSSHRDSFLIKTAPHQGLFELFHHIVTGGDDPDVKNGKPAPDIFLVCASRFDDKPEPQDCLVLEDAPNGVTAAISAGMQCVIVPDKHVPEELYKHATLKLNSLVEFEPELFGLPPIKA